MSGTKRSSKSATLSPNTKRSRRKVIHEVADHVRKAQESSGSETYGSVKKIIGNAKKVYTWLKRDQIYDRIKTANKSSLSETCSIPTPRSSTGGRTKGSTNEVKNEDTIKKERAKDLMAAKYLTLKVQNNGTFPKGAFKKIHDSIIEELSIRDKNFNVSMETIRTRVKRKKLVVDKSCGNLSPVEEIEPVLLQFAIWKQEAGQPITPTEGLQLANSLIDKKPIQSKLKEFQMSRGKDPSGQLSKSYWKQFMRRHQNVLASAKGSRVASNRTDWVTYENIQTMYDLVYEQMVAAGVAKELAPEDQYWVNAEGDRVENENNAVGLKVTIEITHPQWILFGDEVGTSLSQKDDGHVAGQKFLVKKGSRANIKSSHKDGRFTLIGLTAATGEAVMCIIIFAAEELTFEQRMGHDIRAPFHGTESLRENTGPGKRFPGAPKCMFRGKEVEALIACSPKGSITSEILKQAFERLDKLGIYERTPNLIPFSLFDAHDSRLQTPFLGYINDESHLWKSCIGLPNGTHSWQVGDSEEQNGSYKVETTREKAELVLYKTRIGMDGTIEKHDAIPILNIVWPKSFGRPETNKKAISDRGWYPANRRLLTDPEILKTKAKINETTSTVTPPTNASTTSTVTPPANASTTSTVTPPANASTTSTVTPPANANASTTSTVTPPANASGTPSSGSIGPTSNSISTHTHTTDARLETAKALVDLTNLNFEEGLAGNFTMDILQHLVRKEKVCENLHNRFEGARATRGEIDKAKTLTGGNLFKTKHIVLDEEVLAFREGKDREKAYNENKVIRNAVEEYQKRKRDYEAVKDSPKQEKDYTVADYKAIIHFKKRKGDPAVPSLVSALKSRYDAAKDRPDIYLREFLLDRGYEKECVDSILNDHIEATSGVNV
jgi:hypothetical protein